MNDEIKFIDLFAGIGGTRLGFERAGAKCVFTSEWDKDCQKTYEANFGDKPQGDINKIEAKDIPNFDILVGGFPCQPFSSIGKREGFKHATQGTLFHEIVRIFDPKKEFENPYKFLTQHRLDSKYDKKRDKISPIEALQSFINRFIDFEIVEHGKDYVVIKEMGELTGKEFDNSLKRVFFLLQQMTDDLLEAMVKDNPKLVAHMHDVDINLDKFHDYCVRILNKVSNKETKKTSLLFSTLYILELIGDEFKNISTHLIHDYSKTKLTHMIPFMGLIKEMISAFYELFYKFSKDKINTLSELDKKIYFSIPSIYKKAGEEEKEIYHHLRMIERYINALVELRVELEF